MPVTLNSLLDAKIYDLEQPRYAGAPILLSHAPGFVYTLHRHHEPETGSTRTSASGTIYTTEHSGTHIDALCHQAENLQIYGERDITPGLQTSKGFSELGVETIEPLLARAVLLDVAAKRGVDYITGEPLITGDELQATAAGQGVTIQEGDVVLVRTGNGALWHNPERYLQAGGMAGSASQWLSEQRIRAVGADNVAWDVMDVVDPDLQMTLPGHAILLVRHGIYILENLFLEDLAKEHIYEFVFVCLPLKMQGVTGSPVRPIALASRG
ncbi:MAG TPA: cyclase family protein [Ktedonobacteraceae bacterium]|nr:cyclase family protein [Ktedonobacteraceae bacterium]